MEAPPIIAALLALVAVATALGLLWRARTGRVVRTGTSADTVDVAELATDAAAGAGATLLQFSTPVCAACPPTRALLTELASESPGVAHIELDVSRRPELLKRFALLQSPTTLILDGRGVVRARIAGAPQRSDVRDELDRILGEISASENRIRS